MNFLKLTLQNGEKVCINLAMVQSFGKVTENTYPDCKDSIGLTYLVINTMDDDTKVYIVKESVHDILRQLPQNN